MTMKTQKTFESSSGRCMDLRQCNGSATHQPSHSALEASLTIRIDGVPIAEDVSRNRCAGAHAECPRATRVEGTLLRLRRVDALRRALRRRRLHGTAPHRAVSRFRRERLVIEAFEDFGRCFGVVPSTRLGAARLATSFFGACAR
jgi:hypothetical protein